MSAPGCVNLSNVQVQLGCVFYEGMVLEVAPDVPDCVSKCVILRARYSVTEMSRCWDLSLLCVFVCFGRQRHHKQGSCANTTCLQNTKKLNFFCSLARRVCYWSFRLRRGPGVLAWSRWIHMRYVQQGPCCVIQFFLLNSEQVLKTFTICWAALYIVGLCNRRFDNLRAMTHASVVSTVVFVSTGQSCLKTMRVFFVDKVCRPSSIVC